MAIILYIFGLMGVWRHRFWGFWKWICILFVWQLVLSFLFDARGTLESPHGDGLITGAVRQATSDGPEVLFVGVVFYALLIASIVFIWRRMKSAINARKINDVKMPSKSRMVIETLLFTMSLGLLFFGLYFINIQGDKYNRSDLASSINTIEQQVALQAIEERKGLPAKIDEITTLENVKSQGSMIIYEYKFSVSASSEQIFESMNDLIHSRSCTDDSIYSNLTRGVSYRYSYVSESTTDPVHIDVSHASCVAALNG